MTPPSRPTAAFAERVTRVDRNGTVATIAGDGWDTIVDGVPSTESSLWSPTGLALTPEGDLLVADGPAVRRVDHTGIITTIAGAPWMATPVVDGNPALGADIGAGDIPVSGTGDLYIADRSVSRIWKVDPSVTDGPPAERGTGLACRLPVCPVRPAEGDRLRKRRVVRPYCRIDVSR